MNLTRSRIVLAVFALAAAWGCSRGGPDDQEPRNGQAIAEPRTLDIPQGVAAMAPGTTPMADRTAVLGLLNKRNGISQSLTLKPGQAVRAGDVIVRLRACEITAPWETQKLTGAFVQLDVRDPQGQFHRVFSGWLYKETPSLNVVEHPVYVWPKSCAMTHPEAEGSTVRAEPAASSRSSAANSPPRSSPARTPPATSPPVPSRPDKAAESNDR